LSNNKRQYEVVFIVDPRADDEVSKLTEGFTQIITDQGGTITKSEVMGKRQLAYEILHHKDGTFVLLEIEGSARSPNSSAACASTIVSCVTSRCAWTRIAAVPRS
jgi:small subunit ribosomal protein S6